MISQHILRFYPTVLAVCFWLAPIVNFFMFGAISRFEFNIWLGLFGFFSTLVVGSIIYGTLLVLIDIHQLLMDIRKTVVK